MKEKVSEKMLYFAKGKNKKKILIFFSRRKITFSSQSKSSHGNADGMRVAGRKTLTFHLR